MSTTERFRLPVAVYAVLRDGPRVLLLRRAGTTFRPGQLSLPAGHLDGAEDVVSGLLRELREEVGVVAAPAGCHLVLLLHAAPEHAADREYLHLFFEVDGWSGQPVIGEPDRCTELVWVDRAELPGDVVDYVAEALAAVDRGERVQIRGW